MKDYFLFANTGNPVHIQCDGDNFTFIIKDNITSEISQVDDSIVIKYNKVSTSFKKEELITQLEKFLYYVKK